MPFYRKKAYSYHEVQQEGRKSKLADLSFSKKKKTTYNYISMVSLCIAY